jgi:hypothetical protein
MDLEFEAEGQLLQLTKLQQLTHLICWDPEQEVTLDCLVSWGAADNILYAFSKCCDVRA